MSWADDVDEFDDQRRRILRKINLLTWGLAAAAVLLAIGGGALIAWFFQGAGFPFLRTWLIVSLVLVLVPLGINLSPWPRKKDKR